MPRIEYTAAALADLKRIQKYIVENWGEASARKTIGKIILGIDNLEEHPGRGVNLGKQIEFPTNYRYLFLEKNYIFYYLEGDSVLIVRIANERQDFMQTLFGIRFETNGED